MADEILVRAMIPLWYCPTQSVKGDPKMGLSYAPGGQSGGRKYEVGDEFWVLKEYFSDYDTPRIIKRKMKDRQGNEYEKTETLRGSMRRVSSEVAPLVVEREAVRQATSRNEQPSASPMQVATVTEEVQQAPLKKGRPKRPI